MNILVIAVRRRGRLSSRWKVKTLCTSRPSPTSPMRRRLPTSFVRTDNVLFHITLLLSTLNPEKLEQQQEGAIRKSCWESAWRFWEVVLDSKIQTWVHHVGWRMGQNVNTLWNNSIQGGLRKPAFAPGRVSQLSPLFSPTLPQESGPQTCFRS